MKILAVLFACLQTAYAAPFVELGIGASIDSCVYQSWKRTGDAVTINCSKDPLGFVSVGYKFNDSGFTVQADHWSSLVQKDYGLNTVSIRYRYTLGN